MNKGNIHLSSLKVYMIINKEENYMRNEEVEKRINRIRERREKLKNRYGKKYKLEVLEKYTYESNL